LTRSLRDVVEEWLAQREIAEDCSCEHDEFGGCWFRLSPEQKMYARLDSLREALAEDPI
jgi:hypothetical protein